MYHSFLNLSVKSTLKSVDFDKVTDKNKLAPFYGSRCIGADPGFYKRGSFWEEYGERGARAYGFWGLCPSVVQWQKTAESLVRGPGAKPPEAENFLAFARPKRRKFTIHHSC